MLGACSRLQLASTPECALARTPPPGQNGSMAAKPNPISDGFGTLTPYLIVGDGAGALDFYTETRLEPSGGSPRGWTR